MHVELWRSMSSRFRGVEGNAPAVQKMSKRSNERAGTSEERLYPLHKGHTTQVTSSKARQDPLKSHGTLAL
ncbi:hypothetical protein TNCV_1740931 [Trichonephila clavipes]|uniref:Uncharacterized protein n=1 Tax=Trichonephila clavipes TaxID=2585209 RepID=A0A8X6UY58_TRICX|nr:hypothetical protein TNCV_1740931 [Trichonephila clavipes]